MAKVSPSARTKQLLESQGYIVAKTEYTNPFAGPPHLKCEACGKNKVGMKKDLYGFADHIAFREDEKFVVLVQSTSEKNHAKRRTKILDNGVARAWVQQENRMIMVVSWRKRAQIKKDGKKSKVKEWQPWLEVITPEMFEQ